MKPRPLKVHGEPGPGKGLVLFKAMTACDCGCGLPNRFEFRVGRDLISIDDPAAIKSLIEEMKAGFKLLWPDVESVAADPRDDATSESKGGA
jgi:hypothetical protein